jgi:hypothetical protein
MMEGNVQQQGYKSRYNTHVIRIAVILVAAAIVGIVVRSLMVPDSFGKYGHYRADAIQDEMNREIRNGTNASCLACHPYIREMHVAGVHKTVSCEFCHGPVAYHIRDNKVIAKLPKKQGGEIRALCLRCHNQIIRARPKEAIRMVSLPEHLQKKHVQLDHNCNQCHNVHAPLMWVKQAKAMMGIVEEDDKQ